MTNSNNQNDNILFIVADNQDITHAGLHDYIHRLFGKCKVEDASNKNELINLLETSAGEGVVIIDYTLFDIKGIEEFLIIGKRFPKVIWIWFSNELSENLIRRLSMEASVGMLLKECPDEEIRSALKLASKGERYICHQITNLLLLGDKRQEIHSVLTTSEIEILKLIALGKSVKEIADARNSSIHTITTHKKNIFRKLEVNNVYEATKYALRAGLVEMVEYYI